MFHNENFVYTKFCKRHTSIPLMEVCEKLPVSKIGFISVAPVNVKLVGIGSNLSSGFNTSLCSFISL